MNINIVRFLTDGVDVKSFAKRVDKEIKNWWKESDKRFLVLYRKTKENTNDDKRQNDEVVHYFEILSEKPKTCDEFYVCAWDREDLKENEKFLRLVMEF